MTPDLTSTAVLSSPGGPLHESPITHCDGCHRPIPENGFFTLDEEVYCGVCAVLASAECLVDSDPLRPLDMIEMQALDILGQFVHEQRVRQHDL